MSDGSSNEDPEPSYDGTNLMLLRLFINPMQVIGACGLKCHECEAFKATQANDLEKLAELAKTWGKPDNPLTVDDMKCYGCMSAVIYKGAESCNVRSCAINHKVANCGGCGESACDKLTGLWTGYKLNPEDMMKNLGKPQ